jgi:hypothetical protein
MWGITFVFLSLLGAAEPSDDVLRLEIDVHATGTGTGGRMAAIERAKREAVEQVVKTLAGGTDARAFRRLLEGASRYVRNCEVVEQKQNGAETEIKAEAYVLDKALRRDVASIMLPLFPRPPKVVVVLAGPATDVPGLGDIPDAEAQLVEAFRQAGMEVVTPEAVRARCSPVVIEQRINGDAAMAARFAREALADVVVAGTSTVSSDPVPHGSNLIPNRGIVTFRVIRAADAKIVDMLTAEAVVNSRDPAEGSALAVSDACGKIRGELLVSTVLAVAGGVADSNFFVVTVNGIRSAEQWREVCAAVGQEPGVGAVEELYFGEGNGRLRVKYDGPLAPLVERLEGGQFSGFRLEPRRVVGRDMTLAVVQ